MSSPVEKILTSLVTVNRSDDNPVYLQIADAIAAALAHKTLPGGAKMPGTRPFSRLFNIHRKTAVAAYAELEHLGAVVIVPNRGTFLSENFNHAFDRSDLKTSGFNHSGFAFKKSSLLDNPFEFSGCELAFNDGVPDIRLFNPGVISSFYTANLKKKLNRSRMGYFNSEGSEFFKLHFANYLNATRGLNILPDNLLITRGTEMTVYILSELLLSAGDTVVVGTPGYFAVNMIFQKTGAKIHTVPVDRNGIDVEALAEYCRKHTVRMVYVTSHHHYPTTATLSAAKRKRLLELSAQYGFIILEDDYDYDFQYEATGFLPMASLPHGGNVIYIGSFGKTLAPGFQTGFAVSSPDFISEMKKYLGIIDKQGDVLTEQALGEMIREGEIDRHLRKSLKMYRERRDFFDLKLKDLFNDTISYQKPSGGMAFWIEFKQHLNLLKTAERCRKHGLLIPRVLLYQNKNLCAARLGFAHLEQAEAEKGLEIFSKQTALF